MKKFFLFLFFYLIIGCAPDGLERTPFNNFHQIKFFDDGITLKLPEKPSNFYSRYTLKVYDTPKFKDNSGCLSYILIRMHPVWASQILSEPLYILEISIAKISSVEFEKFKQGKHFLNQINAFKNISEFVPEVTVKRVSDVQLKQEYFCFRKDLKLSSGEFILSGATLKHIEGLNPQEILDIKNVKKILISVEAM